MTTIHFASRGKSKSGKFFKKLQMETSFCIYENKTFEVTQKLESFDKKHLEMMNKMQSDHLPDFKEDTNRSNVIGKLLFTVLYTKELDLQNFECYRIDVTFNLRTNFIFITGMAICDDVVKGYVVMTVSSLSLDIRQMVCYPTSTGLGTTFMRLIMSIWSHHKICLEAETNLRTFLFYKKINFICSPVEKSCGASCRVFVTNAVHMTLKRGMKTLSSFNIQFVSQTKKIDD
jgi:hypothetical protein